LVTSRKVLAVLAATAWLVAGCTTTLHPYIERDLSTFAFRSESGGLEVAVKAMTLEEGEYYFGSGFDDAELVAVEFAFLNTSSDASYLVVPEKCQILFASAAEAMGREEHSGGEYEQPSDGEYTGAIAAGVLLGLSPALLATGMLVSIVGFHKLTEDDYLEHALIVNQLRSNTISPGRGVQGVSFVPRAQLGSETQLVSRVIATDLRTGEEMTIVVPFELAP
jgi:hypothetical protein